MRLSSLTITDVRNLAQVSVKPAAGLNILYGLNGSGKTSFLESIHLLVSGYSFRNRNIRPIVRRGCRSVRVTADYHAAGPGSVSGFVGLEKSPGTTVIRHNGETVRRASQLARLFPLLLITPDCHAVISGGPKERRRFVDWGLFHVEQGYAKCWQHYYRVLRQRNALLRTDSAKAAFAPWDRQLIAAALPLHEYRRRYVERLDGVFQQRFSDLLDADISLTYRSGWGDQQDFGASLDAGFEQDRGLGYTRRGPHYADLVIKADGLSAADRVSRGQSKLLVAGLLVSRAHLAQQLGGSAPIVLVDDLPAELDHASRLLLLTQLQALQAQIFVTSTSLTLIDRADWQDSRVFHVEHGHVQEVVQ